MLPFIFSVAALLGDTCSLNSSMNAHVFTYVRSGNTFVAGGGYCDESQLTATPTTSTPEQRAFLLQIRNSDENSVANKVRNKRIGVSANPPMFSPSAAMKFKFRTLLTRPQTQATTFATIAAVNKSVPVASLFRDPRYETALDLTAGRISLTLEGRRTIKFETSGNVPQTFTRNFAEHDFEVGNMSLDTEVIFSDGKADVKVCARAGQGTCHTFAVANFGSLAPEIYLGYEIQASPQVRVLYCSTESNSCR
jgi:hypothetical protein